MAVGGENRRNIRPYVLGFCFVVGLIIGFTAYLYMKTAAQRLEIIEVEENIELQKQKNQNLKSKDKIQQIDPFKKTEEVEKPPEHSTVLAKPEVKLIEDKIIEPNFREPPVIPAPTIEELAGLDGFTVRKPVKPQPPVRKVENVQQQRVNPVDRRKNPFADESVVLDDIAPPELDE